jgi:hypothetical protein
VGASFKPIWDIFLAKVNMATIACWTGKRTDGVGSGVFYCWGSLIVGLVLFGVFDCWVIVGIFLAISAMETIAYCVIFYCWVISIGIFHCWVICS